MYWSPSSPDVRILAEVSAGNCTRLSARCHQPLEALWIQRDRVIPADGDAGAFLRSPDLDPPMLSTWR